MAVVELLESVRAFLWGAEPIVGVQSSLGSAWQGVFTLLTMLGNTQGIVLLVALTLWFGARQRAYYLLGVTLLALAVCAAIWAVVDVPRPQDPRVAAYGPPLPTPSFPSGHAAMTMAMWGTLAPAGPVATAMAVVMIGGVALSRLYLGVHHLGDILVGLLIGWVLLLIFPRPWRWLTVRLARLPWWLFLAAGVIVAVGTLAMVFLVPRHQWEEAGLVIGTALGLPLEYRFVHLAPERDSLLGQVQKALIGVGGLLGLLVAEGLLGPVVDGLSLVLAAVAGLWAVLIAPALFTRLGLARRATARRLPRLPTLARS